MRYKKYLNESSYTTKNWNILKNDLTKKCKPYIKELKNAKFLLVRGVKQSYIPLFVNIRSVRKDRKPRVLDTDLHERIGEYSKEKFGWNIRTEGLFTTKSKSDAEVWGKPVIIFPIGKFKYVWNNDVYDLYDKYDMWPWHDDTPELYWYEIKSEISEYKTNNLNEYLKSSNVTKSECIINCDKYYTINMVWYETLLKYYS